jgi:hypothetical protein
MKIFRWILPSVILAALFFTTSAFAQDVSYNFDKQADFTKYKTYRWEKHPQSIDLDQLVMTQLATGFDAALAKKGLTKKETGDVDLIIVYQLALKQEKELNTYSSGYTTGPGWGGGYYGGYGGYGAYGGGTSTTTVSTITTGSVALDMYEAAAKKLVWRGLASKTVDAGTKPEKREKNIAKAADKMLKNYPPVVKEEKKK